MRIALVVDGGLTAVSAAPGARPRLGQIGIKSESNLTAANLRRVIDYSSEPPLAGTSRGRKKNEAGEGAGGMRVQPSNQFPISGLAAILLLAPGFVSGQDLPWQTTEPEEAGVDRAKLGLENPSLWRSPTGQTYFPPRILDVTGRRALSKGLSA